MVVMVDNQSAEYRKFLEIFNTVDLGKAAQLKEFLNTFGVNFNLFKGGQFIERSFPFDIIPRIIPKNEFDRLEMGIKQRMKALNLFLNDIYNDQKIVKDGIIPMEFVTSAKAFLPKFMGFTPSKGIRSHISGIDLVKNSKTDEWVILEDNLRVPSGVSYPLSIRKAYRRTYPEYFESMTIAKVKHYPTHLQEMMNYVNCGGINVVLTPGRFNSAFYEHSYLAKETGAKLVTNEDLVVVDDILYLKRYDGAKVRVGAVYRRLDDDFLDPQFFEPTSLIGVPGIINAYLKKNVAIINAVGNGVADDKGIYYFVPKMIRYYLGEEPILSNAPTYLPYFEEDRKYILDHLHELVIKDVAEAGGYGVLFGSKLSKEELSNIRAMIIAEPRRFIAQELIEFYDIDCMMEGGLAPRKSDLRAYVIYGEEIKVWSGGLTRYALEAGNYLVNSSQGGGFKDTWVVGE